MKVGILTASRTNNYGTDLQAYAMQKIFGKYCDVEIIDYVCPKLEKSHKLIPGLSLINLINFPWAIFKNISHYMFRKKYFQKSDKYNTKNISNAIYDAIVVGSDQVWNLDITGNDLNFFLPFGHMKKYSYAASLGKTDISKWQEKYDLKKHLDDFSAISVRESVGVDALKSIGVVADWHLDPLLMVNESDWLPLVTHKKSKDRYVFVYLIQSNKEAMDYAMNYAKKHNMRVVVYQKPGKPRRDRKKCVYCNANRWLSYMKYADMVITNSYHGLSMAVAFKRNFRIFGISNSVQNNSRMENLLARLSLSEYMLFNEIADDLDIPQWEKVEEFLSAERQKSFEYINNIVKS